MMNDMNPETRRFAIMVAVVVAIAGAVVGGILLFSKHSNEEKPVAENVEISKTDKEAIQAVSRNFFKNDGTWGLVADKLSPENVEIVLYNVATNGSSSGNYWVSRDKNYSVVRDRFIVEGSPMYMLDSTVTTRLDDEFERDKLMDIVTTSVDPAMDRDKGSKVTLPDGTVAETYTTQVTVSSQVTTRVRASDDVTSDGTLNVMRGTYANSPLVTFAKVGGKWKIWEVQGIQNPFIFSSWREPVDYMDSLSGLNQVDTLKASKK